MKTPLALVTPDIEKDHLVIGHVVGPVLFQPVDGRKHFQPGVRPDSDGRVDPEPVLEDPGPGTQQIWSLSSLKMRCQLLMNDLNQISSVSLLMTSFAKEGLTEPNLRPLFTFSFTLDIHGNYQGIRL